MRIRTLFHPTSRDVTCFPSNGNKGVRAVAVRSHSNPLSNAAEGFRKKGGRRCNVRSLPEMEAFTAFPSVDL